MGAGAGRDSHVPRNALCRELLTQSCSGVQPCSLHCRDARDWHQRYTALYLCLPSARLCRRCPMAAEAALWRCTASASPSGALSSGRPRQHAQAQPGTTITWQHLPKCQLLGWGPTLAVRRNAPSSSCSLAAGRAAPALRPSLLRWCPPSSEASSTHLTGHLRVGLLYWAGQGTGRGAGVLQVPFITGADQLVISPVPHSAPSSLAGGSAAEGRAAVTPNLLTSCVAARCMLSFVSLDRRGGCVRRPHRWLAGRAPGL